MRIQIDLPNEILEKLQKLSDSANRSRKNYIETIIIEHTNGTRKHLRKVQKDKTVNG